MLFLPFYLPYVFTFSRRNDVISSREHFENSKIGKGSLNIPRRLELLIFVHIFELYLVTQSLSMKSPRFGRKIWLFRGNPRGGNEPAGSSLKDVVEADSSSSEVEGEEAAPQTPDNATVNIWWHFGGDPDPRIRIRGSVPLMDRYGSNSGSVHAKKIYIIIFL